MSLKRDPNLRTYCPKRFRQETYIVETDLLIQADHGLYDKAWIKQAFKELREMPPVTNWAEGRQRIRNIMRDMQPLRPLDNLQKRQQQEHA